MIPVNVTCPECGYPTATLTRGPIKDRYVCDFCRHVWYEPNIPEAMPHDL